MTAKVCWKDTEVNGNAMMCNHMNHMMSRNYVEILEECAWFKQHKLPLSALVFHNSISEAIVRAIQRN